MTEQTNKDALKPDQVKSEADYWRQQAADGKSHTYVPKENCERIADICDELHKRMTSMEAAPPAAGFSPAQMDEIQKVVALAIVKTFKAVSLDLDKPLCGIEEGKTLADYMGENGGGNLIDFYGFGFDKPVTHCKACGEETEDGSRYCEEHEDAVTRPLTPNETCRVLAGKSLSELCNDAFKAKGGELPEAKGDTVKFRRAKPFSLDLNKPYCGLADD